MLRDSGHEEEHRKPERMVVPPDTDVYLETVETAQNQKEETYRTAERGQLYFQSGKPCEKGMVWRREFYYPI